MNRSIFFIVVTFIHLDLVFSKTPPIPISAPNKNSNGCTEAKLLQEYLEKYGEAYRDIGIQWSKWAYIVQRCQLRGQKCACQFGQRKNKITESTYDAEYLRRYGEPFQYGVQRQQFGQMIADIEFENHCGCHGANTKAKRNQDNRPRK